jgi:transposase-like protein
MNDKIYFDMDSAIQALREGKDLSRKNGIFTPQIKQLTEAAMQAELEQHLATEESPNRKNGTINAVTDKLLPELQAWRERDLDAIYPIVWLDAIHYKIKENGRSPLAERSDRSVKDILITCVDGLKGFPETIESIYPNTEIQHCVIHQICNSMKYVASKKTEGFYGGPEVRLQGRNA